jgi:hypothetical protein
LTMEIRATGYGSSFRGGQTTAKETKVLLPGVGLPRHTSGVDTNPVECAETSCDLLPIYREHQRDPHDGYGALPRRMPVHAMLLIRFGAYPSSSATSMCLSPAFPAHHPLPYRGTGRPSRGSLRQALHRYLPVLPQLPDICLYKIGLVLGTAWVPLLRDAPGARVDRARLQAPTSDTASGCGPIRAPWRCRGSVSSSIAIFTRM